MLYVTKLHLFALLLVLPCTLSQKNCCRFVVWSFHTSWSVVPAPGTWLSAFVTILSISFIHLRLSLIIPVSLVRSSCWSLFKAMPIWKIEMCHWLTSLLQQNWVFLTRMWFSLRLISCLSFWLAGESCAVGKLDCGRTLSLFSSGVTSMADWAASFMLLYRRLQGAHLELNKVWPFCNMKLDTCHNVSSTRCGLPVTWSWTPSNKVWPSCNMKLGTCHV